VWSRSHPPHLEYGHLHAKEEEESITDALENVVEVIETGDDDGSDDDSPSLTVADLDAAEKATEAAEATLQSYRDKGYGQMDIDEALGAIDVASATEERIRQELKDAEENKLTNNDKPEDISTDEEMPEVDLIATLDAAEKVTDAAREAVEEVKAKGYGQMDIDEANAAFEAAEAEEDKAREAAKAAEKSDPEPSDDTVTEIEDVTVTEDVAGEETDVTATDDGGDTDTGTTRVSIIRRFMRASACARVSPSATGVVKRTRAPSERPVLRLSRTVTILTLKSLVMRLPRCSNQ